jgi:hypothetical protein
MQRQALSAAEHVALLDPNRDQGRQALKLAVMELVVRGVFRLSVASDGKTSVLAVGQQAIPTENLLLRQVEVALRLLVAQGQQQLPLVLRQLQQQPAFGQGFTIFWRNSVRTGLLRQQLLRTVDKKVLLLFRTTHHEHTTTGLALKQQLEQQLAATRTAVQQTNGAEMAALALTLGTAVLLLPELWLQLEALRGELRRLEAEGYTDMSGFLIGSGQEPHA